MNQKQAAQYSGQISRILELSIVREVAVIERRAGVGTVTVGYVVPADRIPLHRIESNIREAIASHDLPDHIVPIRSLPLNADGEVDIDRLKSFPVIDNALLAEQSAQWATRLTARVAMSIDDAGLQVLPYHLDDLLPPAAKRCEQSTTTSPPDESRITARHEAGTNSPAWVEGPALNFPEGSPRTIGASLVRAAQRYAGKRIACMDEQANEVSLTYADLLARAQRVASSLRSRGLVPGDIAILQCDRCDEYLVTFWGCVLLGVVPAPLTIASEYVTNNASVRKLIGAWRLCGSPPILCSPLLSDGLVEIGRTVDGAEWRLWSVAELEDQGSLVDMVDPDPDAMALLLFTSGSTGVPKGVKLSHRNLLSMAQGTISACDFTSDDVTMNWMPLDHVGAVVFLHLMGVYLCCEQVHAPPQAVLNSPLRWLEWIDRFRASISWAPNFAFGLISAELEAQPDRKFDLSSMKFLVNAGEAVSSQNVKALVGRLASHGLAIDSAVPAFGMSETCSGISWNQGYVPDPDNPEQRYVSLGPPIPGAEYRVVGDKLQTLNEGEIGLVHLRGPSVTNGYLNNPDATSDLFTDDGWLDTGDVGMLRNGELVLTGREKDVIIIRGANVYPQEIEAFVDQLSGVHKTYTAACPIRIGDAVEDQCAVFFCPRDDDWESKLDIIREARGALSLGLGLQPAYLLPLKPAQIPKTAIGKIQRTQLRKQLEAGGFDRLIREIEVRENRGPTVPRWCYKASWQAHSLNKHVTNSVPHPVYAVDLSQHAPGLIDLAVGERLTRITADDIPSILAAPPSVFNLAIWVDVGNAANEKNLLDTLSGVAGMIQSVSQAGQTCTSWVTCVCNSSLYDQASPAAASLVAVLNTAAQENAWLKVRCVDLPAVPHDQDLRVLGYELAAEPRDVVVAIRNGVRFVQGLLSYDLLQAPTHEHTGDESMSLITGGLGGIGSLLAQNLLDSAESRVLLIGLTPETELDSVKHDRLAKLHQLPGRLRYVAADVCDADALRDAVVQAENDWGSTLGFAYAMATKAEERAVVKLTRDDLAAALSIASRQTQALSAMLEKRAGMRVCLFASVNGYFGGAGYGAYSAASAWLSAYAEAFGDPRLTCLAWSMWDNIGLSEGYAMKDMTRARGFELIEPGVGIRTLRGVLARHTDRSLFIGIDRDNPSLRSAFVDHPEGIGYVRAFVEQSECAADMTCVDRFGQSLPVKSDRVDQLYIRPDGTPDINSMEPKGGPGAADAGPAPRNDLEREIASKWCELLGVDRVGIKQNFFDLGGNSLLMARLNGWINERYGMALPVTQMYRLTTVDLICQRVGSGDDQADDATQVRESRGRGVARRAHLAKRAQRRTKK